MEEKYKKIEIGDKFGEWTVIEEEIKNHKVKCRCLCGVIKDLYIYALYKGETKSCGCLKKKYKEIEIGDRFGDWLVLKTDLENKKNILCQCTRCNKTQKEVDKSSLQAGNSLACCTSRKKEDVKIGQKIEEWTVLQNPKEGKKVYCECSCGEKKWVDRWSLNNSVTKSCGCKKKERTIIKKGDIFGNWIVLEDSKARQPINCECLCGSKFKKRFSKSKLLDEKELLCCNSSKDSKIELNTTFKNWISLGKEKNGKILCQCRCENKTEKWINIKNIEEKEGCSICTENLKNVKYFLSDGTSIVKYCFDNNIGIDQARTIFQKYGEEAFYDYCARYDSDNTSSLEQLFIRIMSKDFTDLKFFNNKPTELKGKTELKIRSDFKLEMNGKILYVNVDGLFCHCDFKLKKRNEIPEIYHFKLFNIFYQNNIVLFQFREDELVTRPEWVRNIILNYFDPINNPIKFPLYNPGNFLDLRYEIPPPNLKITDKNVLIDWNWTRGNKIFSQNSISQEEALEKKYFKIYDAGRIYLDKIKSRKLEKN